MPTLFPWKTIYNVLVDHGLWVANWLINCLIPVESQESNARFKGITDLWGPEQAELAITLGLTGATKYPLTVHKASANEHKCKSIVVVMTLDLIQYI